MPERLLLCFREFLLSAISQTPPGILELRCSKQLFKENRRLPGPGTNRSTGAWSTCPQSEPANKRFNSLPSWMSAATNGRGELGINRETCACICVWPKPAISSPALLRMESDRKPAHFDPRETSMRHSQNQPFRFAGVGLERRSRCETVAEVFAG